jgi:hypothetical protein
MRLPGLGIRRLGLLPQTLSRGVIHPLFSADLLSETYYVDRESADFATAFGYARTGGDVYAPDSAGTWSAFAAGEPPLTDLGLVLEPAGQNHIRDVIPEAPATGLPANWNAFALTNNGVAVSFVGLETVDGLDWWLLNVNGTASGNGGIGIEFEERTYIAALAGQQWTRSLFLRFPSGHNLDNLSNLRTNVFGRTSGGGVAQTDYGDNLRDLVDETTQRFGKGGLNITPVTLANTSGTVAYVQHNLEFAFNSGAVFSNNRIAVALPMIEQRDSASYPCIGTRGAATLTSKLPAGPTTDLLFTHGELGSTPIADVPAGDYALDPDDLDRPLVTRVDWGSV